jgi:hypothetical protein
MFRCQSVIDVEDGSAALSHEGPEGTIPTVEVAEREAAAMGVDKERWALDAIRPVEPTRNVTPVGRNPDISLLSKGHRALVEER